MLIASRKAMTTTGMKTRMAPSSTSTGLGAASSDETAAEMMESNTPDTVAELPQLDPHQPNLHCLPKSIHPTYRPLSLPVKLVCFLVSMWTSAVMTWKNMTWFQPLAVLSGMRASPTVKEWVSFAAKTLLFTVFSRTLLQDIFLPPSRVSTKSLKESYCLPSPLSNYEQITGINVNGTSSSLGVHYLKYENTADAPKPLLFDALYVLHGFGASSLSWLPPLPVLVEQLGARVGLGHDAVGFGFTDRPIGNLAWYTTSASAAIGTQVLLQDHAARSENKNKPLESVAILGHSLGSLTALKMALRLPRETSKLVVLTAPALGIRSHKPKRQAGPAPWISRKIFHPISSLVRKGVFYPIGGYALRRVVGAKNFWKSGLRAVWGDPEVVSDTDALRFQWPSVGSGWERGLLDFARAQGASDPDNLDDVKLLRKVLELPNTTVAIILGSRDKVIPSSLSEKFLRDFPDVHVVSLEGLGHDPFEEDIEAYSAVMEKFLSDFRARSDA